MITGTVAPIEKVDQGVQEIDGDAHMLEESNCRWIYMEGNDNLYLNTVSLEIIMYA